MTSRVTAKPIASTASQQSWPQRMIVLGLVAVCLLLLTLDYRGNGQVKSLRGALVEVTVPLVSLLSKPVSTIEGAADWVGGVFVAHRENQRLHDENNRLKQWKLQAHQLETQNTHLKQMLNVPVQQATHFVTARAVADQRGPFAQAMMINAGSAQGVALHQPVAGPDGLIGRVVEVHASHARVLLVSDINSRIAVKGAESGTRSLVVGKGHGASAELRFVEGAGSFTEEEMLVTIASETVPAGVPVATYRDGAAHWVQSDSAIDYFRVIQTTPVGAE